MPYPEDELAALDDVVADLVHSKPLTNPDTLRAWSLDDARQLADLHRQLGELVDSLRGAFMDTAIHLAGGIDNAASDLCGCTWVYEAGGRRCGAELATDGEKKTRLCDEHQAAQAAR